MIAAEPKLPFFSRALDVLGLHGPIVDKELRTASRRRRNYLLRFGYLTALLIYIALVWRSEVDSRLASGAGDVAYSIAVMPEIGKQLAVHIVWFQFILTQLVTLFLLSTSISSEIYSRTLPTLLTTPMTTRQIVCGKYFSKLLQVLVLLALSTPLLALLRVFGGVTWQFLAASLLANLSAVVFAGAISLYFSIAAVNTISGTMLIVLLYALVWGGPTSILLGVITWSLNSASYAGTVLIVSAGCLLFATMLTVGLLSGAAHKTFVLAMQHLGTMSQPPNAGELHRQRDGRQPTRSVKGPAMLWKNLRFFLPSSRRRLIVATIGFAAAMSVSYATFIASDMFSSVFCQGFYLLLYIVPGALVTAMMASTSITVEKESRALVLLLTTPMSDAYILRTKALGVLVCGMPCWGMLVIHLAISMILGSIHPLAGACVLIVAFYVAVFAIGAGLYISSIIRMSNLAVMAMAGLLVGVWLLPPILAPKVLAGFQDSQWASLGDTIQTLNPAVQLAVLVDGGSGDGEHLRAAWRSNRTLFFHWPGTPPDGSTWKCSPVAALGIVSLSALIYCGAGALFAARARVMMRRKLFE